MYVLRSLFRSRGKDIWFDPYGSYTFNTISLGNSVIIGPGACFWSTHSHITIGNKVMFGPNVTIMGGNHNTSAIGRYMFDVHEKEASDDQPVNIEDDVWVGAGVIILKGVTVGRGSIIAAGAVVTKNIPPYSIVAGTPARVLKKRWSPDQILEHESRLYGEDKRLAQADLQE
ncbi:MAG TPA: DapH/DapD/GlmU-related protein [Geomonas sp.]|nr:DapH/DapD/GlmU-related protein [Geomonas sp.]